MRPLAVLLLAAAACRGGEPLSLRSLCIRAETVVLARPLDPVAPTRFAVRETLRGKVAGILETRLSADQVRAFDSPDYEDGGRPRPRRTETALLFLDADKKLLGLRLCADDGRVMGLDAQG